MGVCSSNNKMNEYSANNEEAPSSESRVVATSNDGVQPQHEQHSNDDAAHVTIPNAVNTEQENQGDGYVGYMPMPNEMPKNDGYDVYQDTPLPARESSSDIRYHVFRVIGSGGAYNYHGGGGGYNGGNGAGGGGGGNGNERGLTAGDLLGNGAFGKVYRGEYNGQVVAIKWLEMAHARKQLGFASDKDIIESFDWEATNLSMVDHPSIIRFIGVCEGDGHKGLVLELCDGMDLKKFLWKNQQEGVQISMEDQCRMVIRLTDGLRYLHEHGIIHKDVKVENVLWFLDGRVKWADLGVSAVDSLVQENEARLAKAGVKDAYWNSPEEARIRLSAAAGGGGGGASTASDMFSFGLVIYAVMSGKSDIWEGCELNLHNIQECLANGDVMRVLPIDESWWCADFIKMCLAYEPQNRPSASRLLVLLKSWARQHGLNGFVLSQELQLELHTSANNRSSYVESLCSTNVGDVDVFGGRQEEELQSLTRVSSLSENVGAFIFDELNKSQVLVLLGDGGTGKSIGMHAMAAQFSDNNVQFVFIRPHVDQWTIGRLRDVCPTISGGDDKCVFVLDGYDELVGRDDDLNVSLPEYLGMLSTNRLIVTCRRNIVADNRMVSVFGSGVRVRYMLPFTKNQIARYLEIRGAPQPSSLITNPFLLKLYSSSWQHLPSNQDLKSSDQLEKDIYDASVRAWFETASGIDDEILSILSIENFEDFACHVAMSMFRDGNRVAKSFVVDNNDDDEEESTQHQQRELYMSPWLELEEKVREQAVKVFEARAEGGGRSIMSRDDFVRNKLQLFAQQFLNACPLQKKPGTRLFSFVHKSYRDYFCGMAMTRMMNAYIDKVLVTTDAAVQRWASRFVDIVSARSHTMVGVLSKSKVETATFSVRALEFVEHSRHVDPSPSVGIGAANCMTILNTAGVPFSRRNFSNAQLGDTEHSGTANAQPFMDLGGAMLYGCDFSGANLTGARLQQACLDKVNFTNCNLANVEFGERPSFLGHTEHVIALCLSPDGVHLYSAGFDKTVKQWSTASGECVRTISNGHRSTVRALVMSPDGAYLFYASGDGKIRKWSTATAQVVSTVRAHDSWVYALCISADGSLLFSGGKDQLIVQWESETCTRVRLFEGHSGSVRKISIVPDGSSIFSCAEDSLVIQWSVASGEMMRTLRGHTARVIAICVSADGRYMFSGSEDTTVKQWSVVSGTLVRSIDAHHRVVRALCSHGAYVYSASRDTSIRQWSISSGELIRAMEGHSDSVSALVVSAGGEYVYSGSKDRSVKQWAASTGDLVRTLNGHKGKLSCVCVTPCGGYVISGARDKVAKQWSVLSGELLRTFEGHSDSIRAMTIGPDGTYLYTGSRDCSVKQWLLSSGECTRTMSGHTNGVFVLCVSPDGQCVFSGSWDYRIIQWSVATGEELRTLTGHTSTVTTLYVSPDSMYLYSGSVDSTLRKWNVHTGDCASVTKAHNSTVRAVCISWDGLYVYTGSKDNTIKKWLASSGELLDTIHCGGTARSEVNTLCLSLDASLIYSGSKDGTIKVFHTTTKEELVTLTGHSREVTMIALTPDGSQLFSVAWDNTVKHWSVARSDDESVPPVGSLLQSTAPFKLSAQGAIIENVRNMSESNYRLVRQMVYGLEEN